MDKLDRRKSRKGLSQVTVWVPAEKADSVRRYASRIGHRRNPVDREQILEVLQTHRATLERYGVEGLSLFGSVMRGEANRDSDVDLLVRFAPGQPRGLFQFVELKHVLEGLLGRPVDLVTAKNIKPRLKQRILRECWPIFGPACDIVED